MKPMSLKMRREFLFSVRDQYQKSDWLEKGKLLDGFIAASGYDRKYAIKLLNGNNHTIMLPQKRQVRIKYDEQVKHALVAVWYAANQICSKRLVPFIPELVCVMEEKGHLNISVKVKEKLLGISRSTVDRILKIEKQQSRKSISTTTAGNLFKHQIQVRTFSDWDDVTPGFLEADLVAHCGGDTKGSFLNTLTLTDICTGWTECLPLIRKSSGDVIIGLKLAQNLLPFPLLGFDTDNGSEFINHEVLEYCDDNKITFTRSRAYRKNDQAHVEQKNGSIVRRTVGYDRFEGRAAWEALGEMYRVLRVYINFFQPSLKLLSKERSGAKVTKKYDIAKTPHQRILQTETIDQNIKDTLNRQYKKLDPVKLLVQLEQLQNKLFEHAWSSSIIHKIDGPVQLSDNLIEILGQSKTEAKIVSDINNETPKITKLNHYRHTKKIDKRKGLRNYRTRKDPFERVRDEIKLKLELNPEISPKALLDDLIIKYPNDYKPSHLRTLQRRVSNWCNEQLDQEAQLRAIMLARKA